MYSRLFETKIMYMIFPVNNHIATQWHDPTNSLSSLTIYITNIYFSIQIMLNLILSAANDLQLLMRR